MGITDLFIHIQYKLKQWQCDNVWLSLLTIPGIHWEDKCPQGPDPRVSVKTIHKKVNYNVLNAFMFSLMIAEVCDKGLANCK